MKKSDYGILFLVGLVFFLVLATFQNAPGYMDAEYYFGQGIRIVNHHDLLEPFIWNFLNDPSTVTTHGFAFWLPATSFIAAGGQVLSGSTSYYGSRIFFIFMAACIPIMSAFIATRFLPNRRAGWLAGLLSIFSGFYLPFITITDTFTPYMFFGGLFFIVIWFAVKKNKETTKFNFWFIVTGVVAGLMSLIRSDGILWLVGGLLGVLVIGKYKTQKWGRLFLELGFVVLGYMLIVTPWMMRNYSIYGSFFPPGNGFMLWLTKYDDLFVYPSSQLTFSHWMTTGIGRILIDRLKALVINMQTLIASGGAIILLPIMAVGLWNKRKSIIVRLTLAMLITILGVMTLIFPYAGERGGFFHSLSAVQITLWSMVPVGLDIIIQWGVHKRRWKTDRSWKMFGAALVILTVIFSVMIFTNKVTTGVESGVPWNQTQAIFETIDKELYEFSSDSDGVILVNNPPGYTLATGRPSVMIPTGGDEALIEVSRRYNVRFLLINHERADVEAIINNKNVKEHFLFLFVTAGNYVYEFKP